MLRVGGGIQSLALPKKRTEVVHSSPRPRCLGLRNLTESQPRLIHKNKTDESELKFCAVQILANNSTPLCYSKKTRYSAITRVRVPSRIKGYDSSNIRIVNLKFGFYKSCFGLGRYFGEKRSLHESVFVYERWYSSEFEPGWNSCFD